MRRRLILTTALFLATVGMAVAQFAIPNAMLPQNITGKTSMSATNGTFDNMTVDGTPITTGSSGWWVTTSTTQTVSGAKTFNANQQFDLGILFPAGGAHYRIRDNENAGAHYLYNINGLTHGLYWNGGSGGIELRYGGSGLNVGTQIYLEKTVRLQADIQGGNFNSPSIRPFAGQILSLNDSANATRLEISDAANDMLIDGHLSVRDSGGTTQVRIDTSSGDVNVSGDVEVDSITNNAGVGTVNFPTTLTATNVLASSGAVIANNAFGGAAAVDANDTSGAVTSAGVDGNSLSGIGVYGFGDTGNGGRFQSRQGIGCYVRQNGALTSNLANVAFAVLRDVTPGAFAIQNNLTTIQDDLGSTHGYAMLKIIQDGRFSGGKAMIDFDPGDTTLDSSDYFFKRTSRADFYLDLAGNLRLPGDITIDGDVSAAEVGVTTASVTMTEFTSQASPPSTESAKPTLWSTANGEIFKTYNGVHQQFGTYGANFLDAAYEGEQSTSSTGYSTAVNAFFTPQVAGTYILRWQAETSGDSSSARCFVRVQIDGSTTIAEIGNESAITHPDYNGIICGFYVCQPTVATHGISIDFRVTNGIRTAYIRRARLTCYRVE